MWEADGRLITAFNYTICTQQKKKNHPKKSESN